MVSPCVDIYICEQQYNILPGFQTLQYFSTVATVSSTVYVSAYLVIIKHSRFVLLLLIGIQLRLLENCLGLYWSVISVLHMKLKLKPIKFV
jgi:hypothetical protein